MRVGTRDRGDERLGDRVGGTGQESHGDDPGDLTRGGISPSVRGPVEQGHSEFALERADLAGDGGLHEVQALGRAGHAAGIGHRDQGGQLFEIHTRPHLMRFAYITIMEYLLYMVGSDP